MINKARVFVCQEPMYKDRRGRTRQRDLSPAAKYGEIVFILNWSDTKHVLPKSDGLIWKIRKALKDFNEHDYVIPVGDPTVIQLVGIIASEMSGGRYRVLQWDNRHRCYNVIENDIHCQPPREIAS